MYEQKMEAFLAQYATDIGGDLTKWAWINVAGIPEFCKMCRAYFNDGPISVELCHDGDIVVNLTDVCEFLGIDTESVVTHFETGKIEENEQD